MARARAAVSRLAAALALALAAALAGCGAGVLRNPVPEALVGSAQPFGREGLRDWGDSLDTDEVDARIAQRQAVLKAQFGPEIAAGRTPRLNFLALSGGGQWGAFGAGILEAWSKSGTRPEFEGVAGVSTGAIIAPFAFLGPDYDATLREIYTQYSTEDLLETTLFSGIVSGAALADTSRLRQVIAR